jgi:hypothetical protein
VPKSILRSDSQVSQVTCSSLLDNTKFFPIFLVEQITKFVFKKSLNASMPKKSCSTNFSNVWKKLFELLKTGKNKKKLSQKNLCPNVTKYFFLPKKKCISQKNCNFFFEKREFVKKNPLLFF